MVEARRGSEAGHSRREVLNYARWAAVGIGIAGVTGALGVALFEHESPQRVTRSLFAAQAGTAFKVATPNGSTALTLTSVTGLPVTPDTVDEQRFTLAFAGGDGRLVQNMYRFSHDAIDDLDIFIVPTPTADRGTIYVAIFNAAPDEEMR